MTTEQVPLTDIFLNIVTAEDAYTTINQVNTLMAKLYQKNEKPFDSVVLEMLGDEKGKAILRMIQSRQIMLSDIPRMHDFLIELNKALESAKIMQVNIAVEPDEDLKHTMSAWSREMFPDNHIVLDFQQDPTILGGIVIIYEGQYLDFSLRKQVDKIFTEKAAEIKALIG